MAIAEGRVLAQLPHGPTTVAETVTAHAASELHNDVEEILSTVSAWDQHFVVVSPEADGALRLSCAFTPEEVRAFYVEKVTTTAARESEYRRFELQGRWYDLVDTEFEVEVLATGETLDLRGVFLFPTWTDGIIGEICFVVPAGRDHFSIELPRERTHQLRVYGDAWRSGDLESRLATFEATSCSALRIASVDGDRRHRFLARSKDELAAAWSAPEAGRVIQLDQVHHVVSTYYAFAVYRSLVEIEGSRVARETACLLPLGPNGKFLGELSYSLDVEL